MAHVDLEHWVCTENVDRFRVGLLDETNEVKRAQLQGLLSRELLKLQTMFPE